MIPYPVPHKPGVAQYRAKKKKKDIKKERKKEEGLSYHILMLLARMQEGGRMGFFSIWKLAINARRNSRHSTHQYEDGSHDAANFSPVRSHISIQLWHFLHCESRIDRRCDGVCSK